MANPPTEADQQVIRQLFQIISNELPFDNYQQLLDKDLSVFINGRAISDNQRAWAGWVLFLRHTAQKRGIQNLRLVEPTFHQQDDAIIATAYWEGDRNGQTVRSEDPAGADYYLQNQKVRVIKTSRGNYSFIYGPWINNWIYFWWIIIKHLFWLRRHRNDGSPPAQKS